MSRKLSSTESRSAFRKADALPSEPSTTAAPISRSSPVRSSRSLARPCSYPTSRCWNSMRTRPVRSASVMSSWFNWPRDIALMNSLSSRPYRRKRPSPEAPCTIRPRIGIACRRTSSSRPTWWSAYSPRVETARLIDRPAPISTRRMSGRRSKTRISWPRRARNSARSDPTGPAPMTASGSGTPQLFAQERREALDVGEARIQRRGGDAQHVRRAGVADGAARAQGCQKARRVAPHPQGEHGSAPLGVGRREHFGRAGQEPFEIGGQPDALLAQRVDARRVEQLERCPQRGELQDGGIGELPAFRAADGAELAWHGEPRLLVVAPPARESRQVGCGVPLVHEGAAEPARTRVQVLVVAPDGEVSAPIVQSELQVADAVREVEAGDASALVGRPGQLRDVERLAADEVRRPEQQQCSRVRRMAPRA